MSSLNQIQNGIIKEAMEQLRMAMDNIDEQKIALEYLAKIKKEQDTTK